MNEVSTIPSRHHPSTRQDRRTGALWWIPRLMFLAGTVYLVVESARGASTNELRIALALFALCSALFVVRQLIWGHEGARWLIPAGLGLAGVGVMSLIVYAFGTKLDALPLVGSVLIVLGLGWLVEAWRAARHDLENGAHLLEWGTGLLLAAFVLVLVVATVLWRTASGGLYVVVFVVLGVALFIALPVGVNLLSDRGLRRLRGGAGPTRRNDRAVRVIARVFALVVLVSAGIFILWLFSRDWVLTASLATAAVLLILAIISNTHADVALVVAGLTLLAAAPTEEPAPDTLASGGGKNALVALGDSYMSGEGAGGYFKGTDDAGADECRRAPSAYAARIATEAHRFDRVTFFACSGARTYNVIATSDDPRDARPQPGESGTQVDQVKGLGPSFRPTLAIITLGGNDAGFATIGETCLAPGDCSSQRSPLRGQPSRRSTGSGRDLLVAQEGTAGRTDRGRPLPPADR